MPSSSSNNNNNNKKKEQKDNSSTVEEKKEKPTNGVAHEENVADPTPSTQGTGDNNNDGKPRLFGVIPVPSWLGFLIMLPIACYIVYLSMIKAYKSRTYALRDFGMVIHEFDPWFNYRATQYLAKHGWHAFFHWYDYMSWYPLGRPVGTTIYPGLQITAVAIWKALKFIGKPYQMSLNNICCTIPCWFGSIATMMLSLLTYECSGSLSAAAVSSAIMAVIPAHMMRSVGGGFDNECIAMSAMIITFYFWVRSLRTSSSWPLGILTGLAYGYMVAAWGGFIFVLNMISVHAAGTFIADMLRNTYSARLWKAYALYYVIGTFIATCVPPVSMMPFKSLEQISGLLVFLVLGAVHFSEGERRKAGASVLSIRGIFIRVKYVLAVAAVIAFFVFVLAPKDYIGPLSSRVRSLFVKHTLTGNPLVDSVAEHNPATEDAYFQFLHHTYNYWYYGTIGGLAFVSIDRWRGGLFLVLYSFVAFYFSLRMARMIILTAPIASAFTGIVIGGGFDWCVAQFVQSGKPLPDAPASAGLVEKIVTLGNQVYYKMRNATMAIAIVFVAVCYQQYPKYQEFLNHSDQLAHSFSEPQIMFKHRMPNGRTQIIDDYREGYFWLRDKTPADSRVLSWWDYGYQITGIGNRTTLADGNTWNHEHIATIGYMLSSPQKRAHSLIKHVADYVLVWAGGMGDDLGKSPHMARIGNSVYRDICSVRDPLCHAFSFMDRSYDKPTPMMKKSLLYNAVMHNVKPGVRVNPKYFQEAYTSRHGLIRIFKVLNVSQESKEFLADPANRKCDAPGSWYCTGQYPVHVPAWKELLAKRRDFGQYEDIHRLDKVDQEYYNQYMDAQRRSGRG